MRPNRFRLDADVIKDGIDPYDFYLQELDICRYGYQSNSWAVAGLCPFHDDRKAGSFKVNISTGAFKCWSCGVSGWDIIAFIQQRDDLDFRETLVLLAERWGVGSC